MGAPVTDARRELDKLAGDLDRLVALVPNSLVRALVGAVVARLVALLSHIIERIERDGNSH